MELCARRDQFSDLRGHRTEQGEAGVNRLRNAAQRSGLASLEGALDTPAGDRFFRFLFGNSPYLGRLLLREPEFTQKLVEESPEAISEQIQDELARMEPTVDRNALMRFLRQQRNRVAVVAAVLDCFGIADVMECARLLTKMADHAVRLATTHLLMERVQRGDLELPPGVNQDGSENASGGAAGWGYFILAMGKHGSGELNYSSDIDLIVMYDPERVRYTGSKSVRDCFNRLTRELARILQSRTGDGYVFRVDLRLRPDASSTPPAVTTDFALDYYPRLGRTWERAALIKARPVAGDLDAGKAFLRQLAPFIWDEGLDFQSVEEIRSMSQQIHNFHRHGTVQAAGHNVKLGRGGIREIEFFVQMHQLAYGERTRSLRGTQLLPMLAQLEEHGHILPSEATTLAEAYLLLRRIEHRIQMINDDQSQQLPESADGLEHIACLMGMASKEELAAVVEENATAVHDLYRQRFNPPESKQDITAVVLEGPEGNPDAIRQLEEAGFQEAETALRTFRGWAEGRHAPLASERARTTVREILHQVIEALGKAPNPERSLARLDRFLAELPDGDAFLAMLRANTWLLPLIALVMGSAPRMADSLANNPRLLKAVLDPAFFLDPPEVDHLATELGERLADGASFEERIARTAAWAGDRRFQVGVQTLQGTLDLQDASLCLSSIADLTIEVLLKDVIGQVEAAHGKLTQGGCAVVAMGKLGAYEMTLDSDLDIVFVADFPDEDAETTGPTPISARKFYSRVAQRLIDALQSRSAAGRLYEVDLRLRPSGESGPLVTRLQAFKEYQAESAWTWEHMSLTRASVVCGDKETASAVETAILETLTQEREPETLRQDVASMRERMAKEYPAKNPFQVKHVRGGLVDLEFIAQYLQLLHAFRFPAVLARGTAESFVALAETGVLERDEADFLAQAVRLQRATQAILRLTWGNTIPQAPAAVGARLANALECGDIDELEEKLRELQAGVKNSFRRHLGTSPSVVEATP